MTKMVGVGAVLYGTPHGLGAVTRVGVGIPGPWGDNPMSDISPGTYEITGTDVALRNTPGTTGDLIGRFNSANQRAPNIPGDPPDQVYFDGETAEFSYSKWAEVEVKTGPHARQKGWVAMKYMAPVGWLNNQIKNKPAIVSQSTGHSTAIDASMSTNKGQTTSSPGIDTSASMMTIAKRSSIPWIIGGLAIVGVLVGASIMAKKPQRAHHGATHRAYAYEARRRRRRYR